MASVTLKERIDKECNKRKPQEVHELILDNARGPSLDCVNDAFENLELLSLVGCMLTSLKGLGKLPSLHRLELSDNKIEDSLDVLNESCSALTHLNLSGNKIASIDSLKPLASLKHLTHLDLYNCPVTEEADYRTKVFELLPHVVYLDGTNRDGEDEPEEDSEDDVNDEEGEEEEDYEDDDDEDGVGLRALADGDLEDDEGEFDPGHEGEEEEEEEEEDDDDDDDDGKRGTKRKHHEEEEDDDDDDDE